MPSPNGHSPLRFGRYVRVSSQEQSGPDTASVPAQLEESEKLIKQAGGVLVDTYQDSARYRVGTRMLEPSGERADRPEWLRLLADIKSGRINAVAAYHSGRLYRAYRPFVDFIELVEAHDVTVLLARDTWNRQFAVFQAWRDREENRTRADRSRMGKRAYAERGYSPTNIPAIYKSVRDEKGRRVGVELRPECRPWLDRMACLFLAHMAYAEMCVRAGTHPVTGRAPSPGAVLELFNNPYYRGVIDYGKRSKYDDRFLAAGQQPPAWDAATCAAIEAELTRRHGLGKSVKHGGRFLFSGVVRCGYCGRVMSAHIGADTRRSPSYQCTYSWRARRGYVPGPPHPPNAISEYKLMALLRALAPYVTEQGASDELARRFASPRLAATAPDQLEQARIRLAEIDAELASAGKVSRRLLSAERERAAAELRRLDTPRVSAQPGPSPAAVLGIFERLDELAADPARFKAALAESGLSLFIRHGELCAPPG